MTYFWKYINLSNIIYKTKRIRPLTAFRINLIKFKNKWWVIISIEILYNNPAQTKLLYYTLKNCKFFKSTYSTYLPKKWSLVPKLLKRQVLYVMHIICKKLYYTYEGDGLRLKNTNGACKCQ